MMQINSKSEIATILPNKNESKFATPGIKSDNTEANPIPALIITAVAKSEPLGKKFLKTSKDKAAKQHITIAPITGFNPKIRPIATPDKET